MEDDVLFPEDFEEMTMEEDELEESSSEYLQGICFEDDFVRNGQHMLMTSSGVEAWKQWCINCLLTERYSSPLYSTDFGIETSEAFKAGSREEAETILSSEIIEALEADPYERTEHVNEINFEWGVDDVRVCINVTGVDEATIDIEITLNKGRG